MGRGRGNAHLDDDWGRYAVAEQLVQLRADLHHARRGLLLDDHICDLVAVRLPVGLRNGECAGGQVRAGRVCARRMTRRDVVDSDGITKKGVVRDGQPMETIWTGRCSVLLHLEGLKDEDGLAHIAVGVLGDELHRVFRY